MRSEKLALHQAHFGICKYQSGRFFSRRGGRFYTFRFRLHYRPFVAIGVYFFSILKKNYYFLVEQALVEGCQENPISRPFALLLGLHPLLSWTFAVSHSIFVA